MLTIARLSTAAILLIQASTPPAAGTIVGRILTADGSSAANVRVSVLSVEEGVLADAAIVRIAQTDDVGRFRLAGDSDENASATIAVKDSDISGVEVPSF